MENTQFLHPGHELNGRELREWSTIHNLLIRLSENQSNLIIESLHQKECSLLGDRQSLYLMYTDESGQHTRETTLDDVIDIACELNYEKMKQLADNLAQIPYYQIGDYLHSLSTLSKHCNGYQQLLDAYTQTIHCQNLDTALKQCQEKTRLEESGNTPIPRKHSKR